MQLLLKRFPVIVVYLLFIEKHRIYMHKMFLILKYQTLARE